MSHTNSPTLEGCKVCMTQPNQEPGNRVHATAGAFYSCANMCLLYI